LSAGTEITRARVSGVVLYQEPGQSLFIESDHRGLLVLTAGREKLLPGDQIEAVGVVGREGTRALLRDSVYRQVGNGPEPTPVTIPDPEVLNENLDGRLVKVRGTLINQFVRADRSRLTLKKGETFFEAIVAHDTRPDGDKKLPLESGLELTGIYRVVFDDARQTRGFELLVRNPDDIRIYQRARFWTVKRTATLVELLGLCLLVGVAWVTALRRRLHRQTNQIRGQLQKEMVLEARHRGIFENASDFIFMTDLEGRFTSFNPAGERMTGHTQSEALTMNIRDILQLEKEKDLWKQPDLNVSGDGTVTFQTQLRSKSGQLIWSEISARLIRDSGQVVSILGIVHDISEHKQIEDELKRARDAAEANTRAKSEFLANMSHEIRTPMNAVIGMSNLLLDTRLDERQKDFAETIRNGAEALLTILNDILDFSKMEAGRLQIETVDFDLREAVDGTVELLAARAAARNLELTAFTPAKLPSALRGDPNRLRQVLLNMLGNALKFTESGEVLLQISVETEMPDSVVFLFEIIDTGVGIGQAEQAGLFRPFTQADSSTTRRFGGTGLGLAISKQIVELLGGRCGVRSELGEGSTFWFTARFAKQTNGVHELAAPAEFADVRVLLVDDSTTACRLLDHYVSAWRMHAADANSGEEAMRLLREAASADDPFSVVVVDSQLPDQDALVFARALRADPMFSELRIVFLNTIKRAILPTEMAEIGLAASLLKPIRQSELLSALMRVLAGTSVASGGGPGVIRRTRGLTSVGTMLTTAQPNSASQSPVALRVLLAEDNVVNQRVALLQLAKLGHAAQPASNGLDVLAEMERNPYDVILMDCHMPEMDGFEATRRLRADPRFAKTRIIALTANAMQGDREKCLAAGMDDYLSKPVRVAELQAALARCTAAVGR
jgi:PAS domain S-box-containing protein